MDAGLAIIQVSNGDFTASEISPEKSFEQLVEAESIRSEKLNQEKTDAEIGKLQLRGGSDAMIGIDRRVRSM
jgi:hypothetical protein